MLHDPVKGLRRWRKATTFNRTICVMWLPIQEWCVFEGWIWMHPDHIQEWNKTMKQEKGK